LSTQTNRRGASDTAQAIYHRVQFLIFNCSFLIASAPTVIVQARPRHDDCYTDSLNVDVIRAGEQSLQRFTNRPNGNFLW